MTELTIRCGCGLYVRATVCYANQAMAVLSSWINNHQCYAHQRPIEDDR
jgi:hypothetical protein